MSRKLLVSIALACGLIAATASAAMAEPLKIRVGWVVVPAALEPVLFARPGLAKHEGKSYTMEPIHFAGTSAEITALASGDLDIASLAFSAIGLAIQNARLNDLRIIDSSIQDGAADYYSNEYMVAKDSPIKTIDDLKGKVLATNAIGSAVDLGMRALLRQHHLEDKRDYTVVETGFPNMKAMLADHKVDLISAVPPFSYDPALLANARTLFTLKDAFGTSELGAGAARAGFIEKNRAALVDYYEDKLRAVRWFTDPANHKEAVDIIARFTKQPPQELDGWLFTKKDDYHNPDGLPDLESLQRCLDAERELGFLKIAIDVKKYADLSLVQEAAKRLGPH